MGVKNFWKIAKEYGEVKSPKGKRMAIDTSIWIHQILNVFIVDKDSTLNIYSFFINRIIKLFYNEIDPIFVFDGSIPELKLKTIRERAEKNRLREDEKIVKGIKMNKKCMICDKSLRICKHGGDLRKEIYKIINEKSKSRVGNHEYNWGEHSTEFEESEDSDDFSLNFKRLNTQSKKMEKLNEIRSKRKNEMFINTESEQSIIESQLKNIQKRAQVSVLIREMNKHQKKIQSDSTVYSEYKKVNGINSEKEYELNHQINVKLNNTEPSRSPIEKLNDKFESLLIKKSFSSSKPGDMVKSHHRKDVKPDPSVEIKDYLEKKYETDTLISESSSSSSVEENLIKGEISTEFQVVQNKLKQLLGIMNVRYIESPEESDSQCAKLYLEGVVDGVVSEDNDILFYGGKVYKNFFSKSKEITEFDQETILNGLEIDKNQLIMLSLLLGCDYFIGVENIGPVKSLNIVKSFSNDEILKKYPEISESIYKEVFDNYKMVKGRRIKKYTNGIVDREKLLLFLETENIENTEEIFFHLQKLKKLSQ